MAAQMLLTLNNSLHRLVTSSDWFRSDEHDYYVLVVCIFLKPELLC